MKRAANRNTQLRVTIALLLLAITVLVLVAAWNSREPSYRGRSLSHWLEQYHSARVAGPTSLEAEQAIRAIGSNALPTLIQMLRGRDSLLKEELMQWTSKQHLIKFSFTPASKRRYQAQAGYEVLGAAAARQVPQLITILTNDSIAQVRQCTASSLGYIGERAKAAVPALLITAKDPDDQVRNSSLWALSRVHADPELVLPELIEALDDPFSIARENAAFALGRYGQSATNAVPALLRTMGANRTAAAALRQIDPGAASGSGVK